MEVSKLEEILTGQQRIESTLHSIVNSLGELRANPGLITGTVMISEADQDDAMGGQRAASKFSRRSKTQLPGSFVAHTLPRDWPSALVMRTFAEREVCYQGTSTSGQPALQDGDLLDRVTTPDGQPSSPKGEAMGTRSRWRHCMPSTFGPVDPSSNFGMACDILCLFVLAYDLTMLPYMLAWDVTPEGWMLVLMWCTLIFWTIDIPRSFFTCIYRDGNLETNLKLIATSYLKTWFIIDMSVVLSDWVSVFLGSASSSMKMLRLAKMGRMLRIIGVMRMLRFVRVMEEFAERSLSEGHRLAIRILMLLMGIMWTTHLMCCAWFFIGMLDSDTDAKWTDISLINGLPFMEASIQFQYMSSFHWAVAQLTLGAVEIVCTNTMERVYNVLCLLVGLLFGSALISSLSATMVDLQNMKKDVTTKLRLLRRYMRENQIKPKLANTVVRQATRRLGQVPMLAWDEVPTMALLSQSLRSDLRFAVFEPFIMRHPLLRLWSRVDLSVLQQMCAENCDMIFLSAQDDLFSPGAKAEQVYYVVTGVLDYVQEPGSTPVTSREVREVPEGTWLSNAAFWSEWIHVGQAVAKTPCKLMKVKAECMCQAMAKHPLLEQLTLHYGTSFQQRLMAAEPPNAPWPDDIEVPFTDYGDLVFSMPQESQVNIAMHAMQQMVVVAHHSFFAAKATVPDKLKAEVMNGKTILMETATGEIERVVSVIALHIVDDDGELFAQIGKFEDGAHSASCQLPGGKQERGEVTNDACKRLVKQKLPWLDGRMKVESTERRVEEKESKEMGVRTKYLRTICHATIDRSINAPRWRCKREKLPGSDNATPSLREDFDKFIQRDVFVLQGKGKAAYYTFLEQEEFDKLSSSSPEQEAMVVEWLAALEETVAKEDNRLSMATPVSGPVYVRTV